jgi:hypothetical protein
MLDSVLRLPFSLDPLIAEAKRRMRRRRLALAFLLVALAGGATATAFALGGSAGSSGASGGAPSNAGGSPLAPNGAFNGGATSGFWGDRSSARTGMVLGCLSRRHYSFAITVRNRSGRAVILTGARGPNPRPHVLKRVAMQVRHAPPPPTGEGLTRPFIKHWSAARTKPVTIRPGQSAVVQSNFLMRHCESLAHDQKVVVPGSFVLSYRISGRAGQQRLVQRDAAFTLVHGPVIRSCTRVSGSASLVSGNIGCALARQAATACRHMAHGTWGTCLAGGRRWGCDLHSSRVQQCYFADRTSRWYRVRWTQK